MWTTDNDHAAQLQFHTGRHVFEGFHPTIGSWVHYGLGRSPTTCRSSSCSATRRATAAAASGRTARATSGPEHAGVRLTVDPANPLPFGTPGNTVTKEGRAKQLDLLRELNGLAGVRVPRRPGDAGPRQGVRAGREDAARRARK